MTLNKNAIAVANAAIRSTMERGLRQAEAKADRAFQDIAAKAARARYNSGAADSPTPPPTKSLTRDKQIVDIIGFIETECLDHQGGILVQQLAESFLFEQRRIPESKATRRMPTTSRLAGLVTTSSDMKQRDAVIRRIKLRNKKGLSDVRVLGWDKHTDVAKAPFYAWALEPTKSRPFTVIFSEETIKACKGTKRPMITHLQDRLARLLRSRFGGEVIDFWFILEAGGSAGVHAHGGVVWPDDVSEQAKVHDALCKWSGSEAPNTAKIGVYGKQGTWAIYSQKTATYTRRFITSQTLSGTISVKRKAKALHSEFHKAYRELSRGLKR